MLACPACGAALRSVQIGDMTIDGCDACGGLWFDADELGRLARAGRGRIQQTERVFEPPARPHPRAELERHCPRCGVPLYEFEFRHTPGVTLDACPECRGIWVDDAELEALAQRRAPRTAKQPATVRQRARSTVALFQRVPCPACQEESPASALVCWVCGAPLQPGRGNMPCPRCDSFLLEKPLGSAELRIDTEPAVEHCQTCGGVWIDNGALSVLLSLSPSWLEFCSQQLHAATRHIVVEHDPYCLCPVCQVALDERLHGDRTDLYVDRCRVCLGVWLDRGELVAIRRVSMQQDVWRNTL